MVDGENKCRTARVIQMGKGSKSRPLIVDRKQFENNWDKIFAAPDRDLEYESDNPSERSIEVKEHKKEVHITESKVSSFFSDNGKKEAVVVLTDKGFMVELYEQSRYIKTIDCSGKSINWAEDVAENYALGMI